MERLFVQMETRRPTAAPTGLWSFLGDSTAVALSGPDVLAFLDAAAEDGITLLRATALFARWVGSRRFPVVATGEAINMAVRSGFSLGLTFPVDHIAYLCYVPDHTMGGDFKAHIRVIYTRPYTYAFDEDIFNADVLVRGQAIGYEREGESESGYLVTTDVYYNEHRVEYTNIQGIAGQKRGTLGFFQKMLFFVPKTLYGLTLSNDDLTIDAFVNQKIRRFEQEPRYRVRRGM